MVSEYYNLYFKSIAYDTSHTIFIALFEIAGPRLQHPIFVRRDSKYLSLSFHFRLPEDTPEGMLLGYALEPPITGIVLISLPNEQSNRFCNPIFTMFNSQ